MTFRTLGPRTVLVAASIFAVLLASCRDSHEVRVERADTLPVRVETIRLAAPERRIALAGTVVPRSESSLGFRVSGKIESRPVERGDRVAAGDLLARLDRADLDLAERNARAALAAAAATASEAQSDYIRYAELRGSPAFLKATYDKRLAAATTAAARLEQARTALALASNQLAYAELRADAAGIVTEIAAEPGQVVAPGQPVLRLARLGEAELLVHVPEHRLDHVRDAESLAVTPWAIPGEHWIGRLREIAAVADPATRSFPARIAIAGADDRIAFGMSATLIAGDRGPQALARLPLGALYQRGEGPAVWIVDPATGALALKPVRIVAVEADAILVSEGVVDGDVVVTAGAHKLDAMSRVRIVAERR